MFLNRIYTFFQLMLNVTSLVILFLSSKTYFNRIYSNISRRLNSTFKGFPNWIDTSSLNLNEISKDVNSLTKYEKNLPLRVIRWKRYLNPSSFPDKKIANHFFRLRVDKSFSKSEKKSVVSSSQAVLNILKYTSVDFGLIYSTDRKLIEYIQSYYNNRFKKICLCTQRFLDRAYMHTKYALSRSKIAAEVCIPPESEFINPKKVLAFDGLIYSQNIGLLIRTAVTLGFDGLYILNKKSDLFNWKCITKGFQFILPYKTGDALELADFCRRHTLIPLVAHVDGKDIRNIELGGENGFCLIMGSEGSGPSKEILQFAQKITLPGNPLLDSLNVAIAGGIIMYQLANMSKNEVCS